MRNPLGMAQQRILSEMQKRDPQKFQQIQQMVSGKSYEQLRQMAENIASDRGIDLNSFAAIFGGKL